jgi:hypothetical protein
MAETLTYRLHSVYDTTRPGITLPVTLSAGAQSLAFKAKLDTGSSYCIFTRFVGEKLGLAIEAGMAQRISTATGTFMAYGHEVRLSVLGLDYDATVYFAEDPNFGRNVLGRQGWLDRVRLGLIDYDGKLYLSDYNDPLE